MKQLSKERLEWIKRGEESYTHDDVVFMARALLAGMAQEPVAWWTGPEPTPTGEIESVHSHETGSHSIPLCPCHAALPAPVVPDAWIPCSERMPEETTDADGGATGYLVKYAEGKEPNGGFNVGVWNVTYLRHHYHGVITHWQPLPAPPKEV